MLNKIRKRRERGQVLMIAALAMAVILGFTALAVDLGLFFHERRNLQNSADAAALAGVAYLPKDPITAVATAKDWAIKYKDVNPDQIKTVEVRTTHVPNDTLYVELSTSFDWIFGRAVGLTTSNVGAKAAAIVGSLGGNREMMPWAVLQGDSSCLDANGNALFGITCSVKVGAGSSAIQGWYGALDYDGIGGGSNEYDNRIVDGTTQTTYCAAGDFVNPCPGTDQVDALSGNKVGGTGGGIDTRLAAGPACDTNGNGKDDFNEVFAPGGTGGATYTVICPNSPWLVIIPIVSIQSTPVSKVTIEGWTLAYLESYACVGNAVANLGPGSPFAFNIFPGSSSFGAIGSGGGDSGPAAKKTPTPTPTPAPTPTPTPGPSGSATPTPAPTPGPVPNFNCQSAKGHWEVQIQIVNASYSQVEGFLDAFNPAGITVLRLIE